MACNDDLTPLVIVVNYIDDWALDEIKTRWSAINSCRILRMLWPRKKIEILLSFDKVLIRFLEGHHYRTHVRTYVLSSKWFVYELFRWGTIDSAFLFDCPALQGHRLQCTVGTVILISALEWSSIDESLEIGQKVRAEFITAICIYFFN